MEKEIKKKGKTLKIVLIIITVIVLIIIIAGVYFYYFHVYKTIKFCISEEVEDTRIPCNNSQECKDLFFQSIPQMKETLDTAPVLMRELFYEVYSESIVCIETCKVKQMYNTGIDPSSEDIDCKQNEKVISKNIHGNEALELLNYIKNNPNMSGAIQ